MTCGVSHLLGGLHPNHPGAVYRVVVGDGVVEPLLRDVLVGDETLQARQLEMARRHLRSRSSSYTAGRTR